MLSQFIGDNNAIVVAHCDDEILFAGGLPIRFHHQKWTIISCSIPIRDPIRAYKFFDVCEALGAKAMVLPYVHPPRQFPLAHLEELDLERYDAIVTHNSWGEYGHFQHVWLNAFIREHYSHKRVLTFGYAKDREGELKLELDGNELGKKTSAMMLYNHTIPTGGRLQWEYMMEAYIMPWKLNSAVETYDVH